MMTSKEKDEAIVSLANQVQKLQDELLLMNIYLTALQEAVCEASVTGKPVTQESLEKRRVQLGEQVQKEWDRMQAEVANTPVAEGVN